ncbi:hypothetical protein DTO271D3_6998 [Paecilomyces variotii]|nr:hypothetical protein DTO271D3_6998 [Paecilomyces variotii]
MALDQTLSARIWRIPPSRPAAITSRPQLATLQGRPTSLLWPAIEYSSQWTFDSHNSLLCRISKGDAMMPESVDHSGQNRLLLYAPQQP